MSCVDEDMRVIHAITPGDHFSPLTGSAIPTVVDGLARGASAVGDPRHRIVVERSTYRPRYDSADVIECEPARAPGRIRRTFDAIGGRLGMPRSAVAAYYGPTAAALRTQPPSVVLAHNAPILPWLLRHDDHRVILYAHNELLRTYSRAEAGRMLRNADAIVCVSESLAERTRDRLPGDLAVRVHAVSNAVDTERFTPRDQTKPPSPQSRPLRVMFVGRMIPDKGADVLLQAASDFGSEDIEVVIVGSEGFNPHSALSPYERELRTLAGGLRPRVTFQPFVDRDALPPLLRTADVLVVPSRWAEPSGLTVGEGLATGLPIIASRVGGIPEVLGPAGLLVEPDDAAGLSAALRRLADDPGLRLRLGWRGTNPRRAVRLEPRMAAAPRCHRGRPLGWHRARRRLGSGRSPQGSADSG